MDRRRRRGFTLIEVLTVIGIIALLAAILFPVFSGVQERNRQARCMSNMRELLHGIAMFKEDNQAYPDALFGVDRGSGFQQTLYPKYVQRTDSFVCPNSAVKYRQGFGTVSVVNPTPGAPAYPFKLADFSSYDFQYRPNNAAAAVKEVHYNRDWQGKGGSLGADKRQLLLRNAPGDTVVTWCLYHSNMDSSGNPAKNTMAIVAFLDGHIQSIPASKLAAWPGADGKCPWQVSE